MLFLTVLSTSALVSLQHETLRDYTSDAYTNRYSRLVFFKEKAHQDINNGGVDGGPPPRVAKYETT